MRKLILMVIFVLLITACAPPPPPSQPNNICRIFEQYPNWYWTARDTQKKWGLPIAIQMAIMFQESGYNGNAKPARGKLLWIIPWKRPSTAHGYSQALDKTWNLYKKQTGNSSARRNDFRDASDFIGWYALQAHRKAGISLYNANALYLAYHEGIGGYQRATYTLKPWLLFVSKKVETRATLYQQQLSRCESHIPKPWWKFF